MNAHVATTTEGDRPLLPPDHTGNTEIADDAGAPTKLRVLAGRLRVPLWARADSPAWIWAGVTVAASGFGLIALAWGQTAPETQVHRQVPYLVSAGLVGVGVVMVGLTI